MSQAIDIQIPGAAAGRFMIEKFKIDKDGNEVAGSRHVAVPWFNNLIVNVGMDLIGISTAAMGDAGSLTACRVGSGSTTPVVTDTALVAQVASSTTVAATTNGAQSASPYFGWFRKTFRFNTGVATGNLSEVGIATAATGGMLFSRALIVDGAGTPTTITVQSDESLDVTYELRLYPPTADIPWSASISGTTYSGLIRADSVTNSGAPNIGGANWAMSGTSIKGVVSSTSQAMTIYNGTLGSITGTPSGTSVTVDISGATSVTPGAYTPGSFQRAHAILLELAQGNVAGGITAFRITTSIGRYQFSVSPALAKDATKRLTLNVTFSWARHTP